MKLKFASIFIAFLFLSAFTERQTPVTIYMIGDSTMADKDVRNENQERGWGQMLPDFLKAGIMVDNHAMNGRSSKSFIDEGRWDAVVAKLKKGDYVFIQFGHNDEKTEEKLHTVPGGSFDENLRRFVKESREKGAIPVLFNSIARRNFPPPGQKEHQYTYDTEGDVLIDTHGEYAESPRQVALEMDVPFVDMMRLTHQLVSAMGPEESKKLFMWIPEGIYDAHPNGKMDNTHLNIHGGRVIAGIAIREVAKIIPGLAPYVCDPEAK